MIEFRLVHRAAQKAAIDAILDLDLDGKHIVRIVTSGSKSARQRGYQWLLYRTIIKSGKGDADTEDELDARCKYRARDIFFEDDDFLSEMFAHVATNHPTQIEKFVREYMHTERLSTAEMAKYLDSIIKFYGRHIMLPRPEEIGLIDSA